MLRFPSSITTRARARYHGAKCPFSWHPFLWMESRRRLKKTIIQIHQFSWSTGLLNWNLSIFLARSLLVPTVPSHCRLHFLVMCSSRLLNDLIYFLSNLLTQIFLIQCVKFQLYMIEMQDRDAGLSVNGFPLWLSCLLLVYAFGLSLICFIRINIHQAQFVWV